MDNIKVSVVVPAYNIEKYIERCIVSIQEQTYKNIEIIIVDDGSTDRTGIVVEQLSKTDNRIKVIHKENGGVTSARIEGVKNSTGDYIGFVDSDDYIEVNMYECLIRNVMKYNADISHCGYQMVFPNHTDFYYGTGNVIVQNNEKGLYDLLTGDYVEPGLWNKIYRRDLFNKVILKNDYDTTIRINEDLLMNYFLFKDASISVYEDICPYHYILRNNSAATSKVNLNKLVDPGKVLGILLKETKENSKLENIVFKRIARYLIYISTIPAKENSELIIPIKRKIRKDMKNKLKLFLANSSLGNKLKIMLIWATFSPNSYMVVHRLYEKITGLDKKYEIS